MAYGLRVTFELGGCCDNHFTYSAQIMDAEYLQRTVGKCLAIGLAEVSSVRPADPIEYLALWLLKQRTNLEARQASVSYNHKQVCS